ncbi:hypothetical protein BP6252_09428 [Coleophoma cylindrospora]|uniref:Uncharacterized protein n=1 Tax=Coleophoma cylindrospora TaxID=1849047 RepID=A0A3D8R1W1_9HELO|nr:hypothetical protein BP6252_09428 [Coleophoma cylindrospora]
MASVTPRSFHTSITMPFTSTKPRDSSRQEKALETETSSPSHRLQNQGQDSTKQSSPAAMAHKKTVAELDAELLEKLENRSGEGGVAGLEYEGGKAVAMKRGVKENMFRLI